MLVLGIDLGTSSVKVSVVDTDTQYIVATAQFPETEAEIISLQPGWAEQDPDQWWMYVQEAILKCHFQGGYSPADIKAIGIAYQMHGLVIVDRLQKILRNAIIWCDSRAVALGSQALQEIGEERCLSHLLNSPGNFTAAKLAWVKTNEPHIYEQIDKIMLPGDFIAMRMTGEITSSISSLSEGIFWDFAQNEISNDVLGYFGFDKNLFPKTRSVFGEHGLLREDIAARLSLTANIPVAYKAGDQPNNALALNVLNPGEVASTAGTSGVIYGVCDELNYDQQSRINSFAHVNHTAASPRIGVLLCINGTGIFNRWIKNITGENYSYAKLNSMAAKVPVGADGLIALPFGNGAERMLNNEVVGAHFHQLDFNKHHIGHLVRAVQEGIAFSFRYGLDIMRENGIDPSVIRAAQTNLFLSDVFTRSFVNTNQVALEFYEGDGSYGAAIGAAIGAGIYRSAEEAAHSRKPISIVMPDRHSDYEERYEQWKELLKNQLYKSTQTNALSLSIS